MVLCCAECSLFTEERRRSRQTAKDQQKDTAAGVRDQKDWGGRAFVCGGSIQPSGWTPPPPEKGSIDGAPKILPRLIPGPGGDPDPKFGKKGK